jgi:hypothetical protein
MPSWPPGKGWKRKKKARNRPSDPVTRPIPLAFPGEIAAPAQLSAADDPPVTTPSQPGGQPRPQIPAVIAAFPVRLEPVPARPPLPSRPLYPTGGHWPTWCVALAVRLVTGVKLSLRATPRTLAAVFQTVFGGTARLMSATTVRCWVMRLGLYALQRPLERGADWAYLIDHTVQMGTLKCFAVVGVRLGQLPYPQRCLRREDLQLIALVPMAQSSAATVEQALLEATLRTGVPRLIVSDEGGDVRAGIDRYCNDHAHTTATRDTAHKGANVLRKLLETDPSWPGFVAQLGQMKSKFQQTPLACCLGPSLRPKVRFMNLAAPLRWARWCLRVLDGPWPTGEMLSDRQREVLARLESGSLKEKLGWLGDYREAIERWCQWHAVVQVVVRYVRRCGIAEDSVETLRRQFEAMKLSPSGQQAAEATTIFVGERAWACWPDGRRLIGSTEVLESLFGELKALEGQQSEGGLTGLMLAVGALTSTCSDEEVEQGLKATPWKKVKAWIDKHVGLTVQSQRAIARNLFAGT